LNPQSARLAARIWGKRATRPGGNRNALAMTFTISLALAVLGVIFAAFVKGITGMGFPIIAVPIAAQFLDPQTTVVALTIPAFLMNVIQMIQGELSYALLRRLRPTISMAIPGSIVGTALLAKAPGTLIIGILGVIVTLYAALSIWRLQVVIQPSREKQIGAVVGFGAGLMGGATSMFAPPIVIFLTALRLPKGSFVSAVALCLIAGQIPQLIGLIAFRLLTGPRLTIAALACLVSAGGFMAGMHLQQAISQQVFAKVVLVLLLLVGLNLLRVSALGLW
jgi:uncharacterized membrane protein YfcA